MKTLMVIYNQAHSSAVADLLDKTGIRGFTKWDSVQGRGTQKGEPHYGSHAWPAKNMAILIVAEQEKISTLVSELKQLNAKAEQQGLRAFIWDAEPVI